MKGVCEDEVQVIENIQDIAISVLLQLFLDTIYTAWLCNDRIVVGVT